MMFHRKQINTGEELLAGKIIAARTEKGLTIEEVSKILGINQSYLAAIEREDFNSLPGGVYRKTFIKKYCSFLGLNFKKSEDSLKQPVSAKDISNIFSHKTIKNSSLLVFPKILKNTLISLLIIVVFFYLLFSLYNSLSKPQIEIFEPADNLITENLSIYVSGRADEKTQIEINNQPILKQEDGVFKELVELKKGLNTITISAQNKHSQKNIIKKQVLLK